MTCRQHIMIGAEPSGSYAPRFISIHPELSVLVFIHIERTLRGDYIIHLDLVRSISLVIDCCHLVLMSVD